MTFETFDRNDGGIYRDDDKQKYKDATWLVNMREIIDSREPELITMNGMGWGDW